MSHNSQQTRCTDVEALAKQGYKIGRKIGEGSYATVITASYQDETGKCAPLACKVIDKTKAPTDFVYKFFPRELEILQKLDHPNIIQIHSILQRGPKIFIFMRYAEKGDLLTHIKNAGYIRENQSRIWFTQMATALDYLHRLNMAHRDLKCENILISEHGNVKVADFGFACLCRNELGDRIKSNTYCGSAAYAAPEVVGGVNYDPQVADIWSLGVILFIMLNGKMPFDDKNLQKLLEDQRKKKFVFRRKLSTAISAHAKATVAVMLDPNPDTRWSIQDIINSFVCLLPLPHVVSAGHNHSGIIADTELSASERNRRLIPYMAFYLPAPELPINQQYAVKHASSAGSAQLRPPVAPSRIPVPVAYMPQPHPHSHPHPHPHPHPHSHTHPHHQQSHYQQSAADVYHTLGLAPVHAKETPDAGATFIAYKSLNPTHKHKTVQHFPPLTQQEQQQQQQQQQQQEQPQTQQQGQEQFELIAPPPFHRQRGKQSKVNLTPFTAQNTLPGHFMPIIYTPLSSSSSSSSGTITTSNNINTQANPNNNEQLHNGNTINYSKKPSLLASPSPSTPTEIVYHKNSHQTQIVTDYAVPIPVPATPDHQQQQQPERTEELVHPTPRSKAIFLQGYSSEQHLQLILHIRYLHVTHSGVAYHVYNEASPTPSSPSPPSTNSAKTAHIVQHQKSPTGYAGGHVNKYESYFHMAPEQQQHSSHLTPQEKYVLYLQQRMKLQRQQQQQHQGDRYHHVADDVHHQPAQSSNTKAGQHQHHHNHPSQAQTQSQAQPQSPPSPSSHHHPLHNYKGLFVRPSEATSAGQHQQVLHIPLRALMGQLHEQPEYVKEPLLGSPAPPQYIDYLIDGPRQSLDEEPNKGDVSPSRPPQHAFILVTTPAPAYAEQPQAPRLHHELSPTRAPVIYKQQPTLRLQPVTPVHNYKATRRPVYITPPPPASPPSETVKITPKYVYVSSKPPSAAPTAPPVKLKPVYKYAHHEPPQVAVKPQPDGDQLPDIRTSSLAEILHKLQASNHLPQTLTPDNIDNSIKTLIRILQNLKQTQTIVADPPQHHEVKPSSSSKDNHDYDYQTDNEEEHTIPTVEAHVDAVIKDLKGPNKHPGPSTGRAGIDYPNYSEIPKTSFECTQQRYKGFFGDPETNCQVWHYCDLNGGKASFLCPNGTIFSQIALTCDWWFNVKCSTTSQLYVLNERLYKYILPFNPKFPEDYNGPIVDKYLAMKFQEMEEKMRLEKQRKFKQQTEKPDAKEEASTTTLPKNHKPAAKHGSGINAQVYEQSSERNLLIDDEIDDISERGTYDTYGQTPTTVMAPTTTTSEESQTLGLRPIVVSSTPEPDTEEDAEAELEGEPPSGSASSEEEEKLQSLRDTNASAGQKKLETTKVSVEKLEVIEIKPDGNTGHLMPLRESRELADEEDDDDQESKH